jgi:hypothetical protein
MQTIFHERLHVDDARAHFEYTFNNYLIGEFLRHGIGHDPDIDRYSSLYLGYLEGLPDKDPLYPTKPDLGNLPWRN